MDDSKVEQWSQAGPLITRLRGLDLLDEDELTALGRLFTTPHQVEPGIDIVAEGMPHDHAWAVSDGWAMGYRNLVDGRRQILEFIVPGDIFGLFAPVTPRAEYGVESITAMALGGADALTLSSLFVQSGRLGMALTWLSSQQHKRFAEQIVRLGRRNAAERMAHLFLELRRRQMLAGVPEDRARWLPLTQRLVADCLGMSTVHANRSFRKLISDGGARIEDGHILLTDPEALRRRAGADPSYLDPPPAKNGGIRTPQA